MTADKRIAVGVSGEGSNLRALHAAARRGILGGQVTFVFADRHCPAIEFASSEGVSTAVLALDDHPDRQTWDRSLASALDGAAADLVVLAGLMRVLGPATLSAFPGRILNVHPSLLPAFPGRDAIRDALAAGVRVTGVTVHVVDETLDGGPIVAQEAVPILADDGRDTLAERIHSVEHRLLPRAVALALAGALHVEGSRVSIDPLAADSLPRPRRALISVSDKRGLEDLGRGLAELGFELVSTGGTARNLRAAGLPVTEVGLLTGWPEMLDGRVKTLHPRVAAGVLADVRREDHRAQLMVAGIEPFELVVVNLYPFADAARRAGVAAEELTEEIDIGGPTLIRAAAKNHGNVTVVTDPAEYPGLLATLGSSARVPGKTRRRLAVQAFEHTAAYDRLIADELPGHLLPDGSHEHADGAFPARLDLGGRLMGTLRYGENPHQPAALYTLSARDATAGPFAAGAQPLQGKELSYNNILDASAAAAMARDLRGAACVIVKHTNPCGAAEARDLVVAWERASAGDPVSAFGGVAAIRGVVDESLAERLTATFLEVVIAAGFDGDARTRLATRPDLRLLVDEGICQPAEPVLEYRSAGGALLAMRSDAGQDDPRAWDVATSRDPTERELHDLDVAWRVVRHVKSNAIVLVRDGAVVGVGAGQMSRVDSARLAVAKAAERSRGAVCASDAFYPFADGVDVCLAAGVTAFVQPGGSRRDAEVIVAAERAGVTMLLTGRRHFRH